MVDLGNQLSRRTVVNLILILFILNIPNPQRAIYILSFAMIAIKNIIAHLQYPGKAEISGG
jgi:hypothetical protein